MNTNKAIEDGFEEGQACNRDGCKGVIENFYPDDLCCACHINPPCTKCTYDPAVCNECDWTAE